jgi:hypothetical protein
MRLIEHCERPPDGWTCSREPGHDGPCAESPVEPMSWEETARRLQAEKIALHDQLAGAVDLLRWAMTYVPDAGVIAEPEAAGRFAEMRRRANALINSGGQSDHHDGVARAPREEGVSHG